MENIIIDKKMLQETISSSLPKLLSEALVDRYDSPLRKCIENSLKENEWIIKSLVNDMIKEVINDTKFKDNLKDSIILQMINKFVTK